MDEQNDHHNELNEQIEQLRRLISELSARIDRLENPSSVETLKKPDPIQETHPASPADGSIARVERPSYSDRDIARREAIRRLHAPADASTASPKSPTPAMRPIQRPIQRSAPKPAKPAFKRPAWMTGTSGLIFAISLIGVIVLLFGAVYFLKYAYDEGWIQRIPPSVRCSAMAGFGLLLVSAGEIIRRKISALASSGISAAGIAVMYAAILTAAKMFGIIGTPAAFSLMVAVTIVGILLGSLSNRVALALLSLVGAFLVPIFLRTDEPSHVVMPAYLLSLLCIGLVLAGWRGGAYSYVRKLAWWGTGILGTLWLTKMYNSSPTSSLVFVGSAWLATVIELVVSSRFFRNLRDGTPWSETSRAGFLVDESGEKTFNPLSLLSAEARWINALFGATVWGVGAAAFTIGEVNPELVYLAPLGFALASCVIGWIAIGRKDRNGLWAQQSNPRSALGAALTINGSLLVVATIATALGGWVQVIAWATVGLAAIETARRIRFRAAGIFGLALIAVAAARLLSYDMMNHLFDPIEGSLIGLAYSAWTAQMLFVGAICAAAAWRSRYAAEKSVAACVAMWLIAISLLHSQSDPDALGPTLLVIAMLTAWINVRARVSGLLINAFVLAGIGMSIALLGQLSFSDFDLDLDINPIAMIAAGLAWIALAALPGSKLHTRVLCASAAVLAGAIAIYRTEASMGNAQALLFLAIYGGVLALLGLRLTRWALMEIAGAFIWLVSIGWAGHQLNTGLQLLDDPPMQDPSMWAALVCVLVSAWIGIRLRRPKNDDSEQSATRAHLAADLLGTAWVLLLLSSSIEAERAARSLFADGAVRGAAVSIWWSLYAVASIIAGFRYTAMLRWAGLALLGIVAIKVLAFDTVVLNPPARVVAALSVGIVIIGAGVLYAWLAKITASDKDESDTIEPHPDPE